MNIEKQSLKALVGVVVSLDIFELQALANLREELMTQQFIAEEAMAKQRTIAFLGKLVGDIPSNRSVDTELFGDESEDADKFVCVDSKFNIVLKGSKDTCHDRASKDAFTRCISYAEYVRVSDLNTKAVNHD